MSDELDHDLLDRYLSGEASPAERARVDAWCAADPARVELLACFREALEAPATAYDWNVEAAWSRVRERTGEDAGEAVQPAGHAGRWAALPRGWLLRAAGIAAVAIGTAALLWQLRQDHRPPAYASTVATAPGQRDTVRLADGSTAVLAPASRLDVEARFGESERTVRLRGEAFFTVAHDASRPFRVEADGSVTQVLGTQFDVRAVGAGQGVTVAVREGRVSLRRTTSGGGEVVLTTGQVGRAPSDRPPEIVPGQTSQRWLAWLDGVLEFDRTPLDEVVRELERWYGEDIRIPERAIRARRVSGRFTTVSLPETLEAIGLALGVRYERSDSVWVIRSAGRE